jgi:hypothetical protein
LQRCARLATRKEFGSRAHSFFVAMAATSARPKPPIGIAASSLRSPKRAFLLVDRDPQSLYCPLKKPADAFISPNLFLAVWKKIHGSWLPDLSA